MGKSFSVTADLSGLAVVSNRVRGQIGRAVRATLTDIQDHAWTSITDDPKTGRIYGAETEVSFTTKAGAAVGFTARKGRELGDDGVHQASAPGEAPANDTGNLARGIEWRMTGATEGELTVAAEYAAALELGSEDGTLAPRPFLGPAVEANEASFQAACAVALREATG